MGIRSYFILILAAASLVACAPGTAHDSDRTFAKKTPYKKINFWTPSSPLDYLDQADFSRAWHRLFMAATRQ